MNMGLLLEPQRTHYLQLCGAASRPVLDPRHAVKIRELITHEDWRPLPRLTSTWLVEPMILHHITRLGIDPKLVFEDAPPPASLFEEAAAQYYQRSVHMYRLLEAFRAAGIGRVMLIQGTALAPLYTSPALRRMFDLDLVIEERYSPKVREVLLAEGWRATSGNWVHKTGINLDLHVPETKLANHLWEKSIPHPAFDADLRVVMPDVADHLVYLALHTAKHTGDRLWRDLSDVNLLLANGANVEIAREALARAARFGAAPALSAIFRMLNRWTMPTLRLPERTSSNWTSQDERAAERHASLYEELSVESVTSTALDLLESFKGFSLSRLFRRGRSKAKGGAGDGVRRDPLLGEIPAPGSLSLHFLKLKLIEEAFRHQQLSHYWKLIRARRSIRRGVDDFRPLHG